MNVLLGLAVALIGVAIFFKISFDISVRQLKKFLPEAEYKIQLAITKLEKIQADKIAWNDFNKKKRRMKSLKCGVTIDIDDNESKIDRLEEQATPHELSSSDLSEQAKSILRGNDDLEK